MSPGRRAPLEKLYDRGVSLDESVTPVVYDYLSTPELEARRGEPGSFDEPFEGPSLSCYSRFRTHREAS